MKYPEKKLIAIFQPHQARRVLQFWEEFTNVMKQFDEVIIYDIYAARENIETLLQEYSIPNKQ
jgi:UDP-N-acetylmuramate--alanine ligase